MALTTKALSSTFVCERIRMQQIISLLYGTSKSINELLQVGQKIWRKTQIRTFDCTA